MIPVVLESPYSGDIPANEAYARFCLRHSLGEGEAPLCSHLLYPQPGVLDEYNPAERAWGITAGHRWIEHAFRLVVYADFGISSGMAAGIEVANRFNVPISYRYLLGGKYANSTEWFAGLKDHADPGVSG